MIKIFYFNLTIALILLINFGCKPVKTLRYGGIPTQHDAKHFPQRKIMNAGTVFNFHATGNDPLNLGEKIGLTNKDLNSTNVTLNEFVKLHKTISFLIIRNDSIIYQYYKPDYTAETPVSSFSLIKPFVSTLIGIAIEDGLIKSQEDYITDYLPDFRDKTGFNRIKIRHLLQHTSGISFSDGKFNPASDNAQFYWGKNLRYDMFDAGIEYPPGEKFKYGSENTLLLGYLIETVTKNNLSTYFETKLWKPLGMSAPASWSLDRADSLGIEKAFCCFQARPIDFAKLGRLYLQNGAWDGKQIISPTWIKISTSPDPRRNNKHFYNNNWGIGPLKYGSYFAVGLYGQFLYIYPEKNTMILRFGDTDMGYHPNYWSNTFLQVIDQLGSH